MSEVGTAYIKILPDLGLFEKTAASKLEAVAPRLNAKWARAAGGVAAVGTAAALVGKALYDIGQNFDAATDKIRTGTGATGKRLERLRNDLKVTYAQVPSSLDDTATAITKINARLHLVGKPLQDLAKQELNLSRITKTDLNENIEATTRLFGDWKAQIKSPADAMDRLFRLTQKSGISLSDLSRLMVEFGSPLRQLGFHFDNAAAMFAKFEAEGVNLQTIMPGFRFALKNLSAPIGEAADMMKKLGISTKDPEQALQEVFAQIKKAPSDLKANAIAFAIFGRRAGPDMAAAIREGRFSLGDLLNTMQHGKDTIDKAAKSTNDFSENWAIFTHRLQVLIEPAASAFFRVLGEGMAKINNLNLRGVIKSLREFWAQAGVVRTVWTNAVTRVGGITKSILGGMLQSFRGFGQTIRGIVEVISGVLTGHFGRAWKGVKDIFKGSIGLVLGMLKTGFGGVGALISKPFQAAVGIVRGFINDIISVINTVLGPVGVHINPVGGGGGTAKDQKGGPNVSKGRKFPAPRPQHFQGGKVTAPGYFAGEEAPRYPEFILATNPAYRKRNLGLWAAAGHELGVPGFSVGGIAKTVGGAALGAPLGPVGAAAGALAGSGAAGGFHLPGLGKFPDWLKPAGRFVLEKVTAYIKKKLSGPFTGRRGGGGTVMWGGVPIAAWIAPELKWAQRQGWGGSVTSGYRSYAEQAVLYARYLAGGPLAAAPGTSEHESTRYPGGAVDVTDYTTLSRIAPRYPGAQKLIWFGPGDPVHFSGTGHKKGGVVGKISPHSPKRPAVGDRWIKNVGGNWNPDEIYTALRQLGAPKDMAGFLSAVSVGESGGNPRAIGHDPGGTLGLGLLQITTGYNDGLIASMGGRSAMLNPWENMIAAMRLWNSWKRAGRDPRAAWYGHRGSRGRLLLDRIKAPKVKVKLPKRPKKKGKKTVGGGDGGSIEDVAPDIAEPITPPSYSSSDLVQLGQLSDYGVEGLPWSQPPEVHIHGDVIPFEDRVGPLVELKMRKRDRALRQASVAGVR